jgi:predicted  nucleic acid-binding Zn-ribbon protein
MNEEPTKDLATRAFQKRVLDEFAAMRGEISAIRTEQSAMRSDVVEIRTDIAELRVQQAAMAKDISSLDLRVTSIDGRLTTLEEKVDARLKETRPIWEAVQEQLQRAVEKFDIVLRDIYDVRIDVKIHGRRIGELERRVLS